MDTHYYMNTRYMNTSLKQTKKQISIMSQNPAQKSCQTYFRCDYEIWIRELNPGNIRVSNIHAAPSFNSLGRAKLAEFLCEL